MNDLQALLVRTYTAFNQRDIDAALASMSDEVSWPKASEGGRVVGKQAIRAYWLRQWAEFNPQVDPVAMTEQAAGRIAVKVHQVVKSRAGEPLFDGFVEHVYTFAGGFIQRMDLAEEQSAFGGRQAEPTA